MKSAKIVPATAAQSWLFPKISANPLFTLAEKRRFYRPKLPALRAEVDGLAQKSAKPFLLLRRLRLCFLPASPLAALFSAGSCLQACFFCVCCFRNTPARRRNVRFWGFWRVRARLCPESRTNRRHGRDGAKRGSRPQRGGSLVAASFSLHRPTTPLPPAAFSRSSPQGSALPPAILPCCKVLHDPLPRLNVRQFQTGPRDYSALPCQWR